MNRFQERRWDYKVWKLGNCPHGYDNWAVEVIIALVASGELIILFAIDAAGAIYRQW